MFINLFEASEVSYMLVFLLRYTLVKLYESFWQISTIFLLLTGQLVAARLGNFVYFDVARL